MTHGTISIGPEFFAKAKNDYQDWRRALIREAMQNGIDAPKSTQVSFDTASDADGNMVLTFANNGTPMTRDELVNKFLALGGSGKNCESGAVGGFGKAKELLVLGWLSYEIRTGNLLVQGSGANYTITECEYYPGTSTTVVIQKLLSSYLSDELHAAVEYVATLSQWKGLITLNGKAVECGLHRGRLARDLGWAKAYSNRTMENKLIVRIGGVWMFSRWINSDRCVVVELQGKSLDLMTSNRDGLQSKYNAELNGFIDELTVDKKSALDNKQPVVTIYQGKKLNSGEAQTIPEMQNLLTDGVLLPELFTAQEPTSEAVAALTKDTAPMKYTSRFEIDGVKVQNPLDHEFLIKNTVGMKVPSCYIPGDMGWYSKKLVKVWARAIITVARLVKFDKDFAVGFILDEDREAEYSSWSDGRLVFYVNPVVIKTSSSSRTMAKRWSFDAGRRWALVSVAAHEVVHAMGYGAHDEYYAGKLTDVVSLCLANRNVFQWCFK